jgi:hypothetical protein
MDSVCVTATPAHQSSTNAASPGAYRFEKFIAVVAELLQFYSNEVVRQLEMMVKIVVWVRLKEAN